MSYSPCPCCGTTKHLKECARYDPKDGFWQFIRCARCESHGGEDSCASGARVLWDRGPIYVRAEVA